MANYKAARRYTTAIYELADEQNQVDTIKNDFVNIAKSLKDSRDLKLFIQSPLIMPEKKSAVLTSLFNGKVSDLTLNFLLLLCEKNRIDILKEVSESLLRLVNEKRGIIEAVITTAVEMTEQEKKVISEKLKNYTGKEIFPRFVVDKTIKGGFIAKIDDKIIDASILHQLDLLKEKFISGNFNN